MCDVPRNTRHKVLGDLVYYSCGTCQACKIRRVNDWVFRLSLEAEESSSAYFITLTYNNENLQYTKGDRKLPTINIKELQTYWKRLRKLEKGKTIKYYAVGEYGTKNKRPHYHAIVFNASPQSIRSAWTKQGQEIGYIHIDAVNQNTIAYTCKYIDKNDYIGYSKDDPRQRKFSIMSRGIGNKLLTPEFTRWYISSIPIVVRGHSGEQAIPRYYWKKIAEEVEKTLGKSHRERLEVKRLNKFKQIIKVKEQKLLVMYRSNHRNHDSKIIPTFEEWKMARVRHKNRLFNNKLKSKRNGIEEKEFKQRPKKSARRRYLESKKTEQACTTI